MHKRTIISFLLLIFMLGSMLIVEPALAIDGHLENAPTKQNGCDGTWEVGTSSVGDTTAPGGGCGSSLPPAVK